MAYIHLIPDWPHLKWDQAKLANPLANVRHQQGRLLGRMENLGFELRQEASLSTLTTDVVQTSAIEGEHLDVDAVRSSIARRLGIDEGGVTPSTRDVEGIVEVMLDATQKYNQPLTVDRLFGWHGVLFPTGRSGLKKIKVGAWRPPESDPMQVVSGPIGREKVHFEAPSGSRLPQEMEAFLDWFETFIGIDPVLKAGVAHLWFVTIHPFEDGNGRIGRAIADMALARSENIPERFYSLSGQIESEKNQYYSELEKVQKGSLDITPWLEWFLGCLEQSIVGAEHELSAVLKKARLWESLNLNPVNERQRKAINLLLGDFKGKLSTSKYAKIMKCSEDTALRDIKILVERGILFQDEARGRSTSYSLANRGGSLYEIRG